MKKLIITMLMTIAGLTTLMAQQTHDIKGVVTDKRNEAVVDALVTAEGTDISSITVSTVNSCCGTYLLMLRK